MPRYRKAGRDVDLTPEDRARLDETMRRTPDELLELEQVRRWYAEHRPGSDEDSADVAEPACFLAEQIEEVRALSAALKARRLHLELSLADVSERSGLPRAALLRLEDGHRLNPTLDTLSRYARALGLRITLGAAEAPADPAAPTLAVAEDA